MKYDYDLVIIGGGSAGIVAAQAAPRMGVRTALVERARIGGDCLWTGCVPSKALLASAKAAHTIRRADRFGLPATEIAIDTASVWRRIREAQEEIASSDESPERFTSLGVEVIFGEATLADEHEVRVGDRTLVTRYVLICTGSRPACPPIEGLKEIGYLSSENVFQLERAPHSLLVIGGGPIGVEMAQGMNRLGVQTTLFEQLAQLLPQEEPSLASILQNRLREEGVDVHVGAQLTRASATAGGKLLHGRLRDEERSWSAEEILVAAGRDPVIQSLGLNEIGVKTGPRGIVVDEKLRTNVKSIYAAGDCVGRFLLTHSAASEAVIALRNMFYPASRKAMNLIPWATFTDPELAHVGMTSTEAKAKVGADRVRVLEWEFAHTDRARAEGATAGKVILVTDANSKLLGAHILAPAAGEMIGQLTAAIERGSRVTPDIMNQVQVYPTFSSALSQLAAETTYRQLDKPFFRALRRLNDLLSR